ncbi:MAG: hypothetical protein U5Q03_18435 [Bacteroidota bacterium]|nr:hypothetical protein [Bacteroidota bacterium]
MESGNQSESSLKKTVMNLPNVVYSTKAKPDDIVNNGVITYHKTAAGTDVLTWLDEERQVRSRSQNRILKVLECALNTPALEKLDDHFLLVERAVEISKQAQKSTGGHLGKRSSVRYKTYMRLKRFFDESKNTLFENEELKKAIDDIYKYPMQESAKTLLNRRIRLGLTDQELSEIVINLRAEGRLCLIDEESTDFNAPRVICSMGLKEE